ncbi:MarR family winged helix-turn-helix transcriptional regulator [Arsenicibacter rosenii]|uniref:MarR family transcriptional regulator n=1 Tax=Arsenicibacter rosenii TaxID=1750698 RepID=A0A1S2VDH7_9BACT|nr:MarR family winged helix-turn-helix transcriptional regulator [Arsenicibacter rosenii]OIN55968.1 MarR family transcriptional regulator [Arsenicibacter rosenii]
MGNSDFDLDYQNQNTESKIVASFERLAQAFRVLLWQESKEHALTPIQVQVLIFLLYHSKEKRKVSYLADEFNMARPTISDVIKVLREKELVENEKDLADTRSYVINLTERGRQVAAQTSLFSKDIVTPIANLPSAHKEVMLISLLEIIRDLNKSGVITIQRMCMTCKFYQVREDNPHFCQLLNLPLQISALRIDCPEHTMA